MIEIFDDKAPMYGHTHSGALKGIRGYGALQNAFKLHPIVIQMNISSNKYCFQVNTIACATADSTKIFCPRWASLTILTVIDIYFDDKYGLL